MKILIDECVWEITVKFIKDLGHEVLTIQDLNMSGEKNGDIISKSVLLESVFITRDMDFSNILNYPPKDFRGIIVLKITPKTTSAVHSVLKQVLEKFTQEDIKEKLIVIDHSTYRIRT